MASSAVLGREDLELGQVPVAFVALRDLARGDGEDARRIMARLAHACAQNLVPARRPASLHVVESLPTGPTGKVRRHALREPGIPILYSTDSTAGAGSEPGSETGTETGTGGTGT